jgi:hypothetical protein
MLSAARVRATTHVAESCALVRSASELQPIAGSPSGRLQTGSRVRRRHRAAARAKLRARRASAEPSRTLPARSISAGALFPPLGHPIGSPQRLQRAPANVDPTRPNNSVLNDPPSVPPFGREVDPALDLLFTQCAREPVQRLPGFHAGWLIHDRGLAKALQDPCHDVRKVRNAYYVK